MRSRLPQPGMSFVSQSLQCFAASGAVAHKAYALSLCSTELNPLPDLPGRSDTVRSKDVAKLNSLPEDRTGEHAELLEQHEFSLARYAVFINAFAILSKKIPG